MQCWTQAVLQGWYGPAPTQMHVQDQLVQRIRVGGSRYKGRDTVFITDSASSPVPGAVVTALYSGPNSGTASGTTGTDGHAILETPLRKNPGAAEWCFEVSNVTKTGYAYNPAANVVTRECESGPVFQPILWPETTPVAARPEERLWISPNPMRAGGVIEFVVAEAGVVELDVFDLMGRKVTRLLEATVEAGPQSVSFDATDEAGRPLANGIYFVRVTTPRSSSVERLAVFR
jgi:hypothetical protein